MYGRKRNGVRALWRWNCRKRKYLRFARFSCRECVIYHFSKENRAKRKFRAKKLYVLKRAYIRHDFCSIFIDSFFFFMIFLDYLTGNRLAGMRACFFCMVFVVYLLIHWHNHIVLSSNFAGMRGCFVFMCKNADFAKWRWQIFAKLSKKWQIFANYLHISKIFCIFAPSN